MLLISDCGKLKFRVIAEWRMVNHVKESWIHLKNISGFVCNN